MRCSAPSPCTSLVQALALAGVLLLLASPVSATVIAQSGIGYESVGCNTTPGTPISDPSFAQNAGSDSHSDFAGSYNGQWDVVATPSLVTADVRAAAFTAANHWTCVPALGTVNATDLTFSSVGGTETTINVRFSLGFTSVWSGSNTLYRGVWTHAQLGPFVTGGSPFEVISRPPDDAGSDTACYTSPWIQVPVGVAQFVQYQMYAGTQAGAQASAVAEATSTMSAGCNGGSFIEIQETGFTVDSAQLGLASGAFLPEPAAAALLFSGLLGLALRRGRPSSGR